GRCAAKCTACCPVPLPTSSTLRAAASAARSTARIGSLLRSHASECTSMERVCDNACMQAIDALLSRHSARALSEPAPDAGALELIFAAAVRAPDHGRLRPWRFVLIGGAARARLGELLAAHLAGGAPRPSEETLERERQKAYRAPLIVAVAAHVNAAVKIPA